MATDAKPPKMTRLLRKRKMPGTPPGTVQFVAARSTDAVRISSATYSVDHFEEISEHDDIDSALACRREGMTTWINVDGLHEEEILQRIGSEFNLHPLVLEDVSSLNQRAKVEFYPEYVYVVVRMLKSVGVDGDVIPEQVSLIIGHDYVISIQETRGDVFEPVRDRLRRGRHRIRSGGADYLSYALLDVIVDHYFLVLESLDVRIEELEEIISERADDSAQNDLRQIKRNLVVIRRATWPVRELLSQIDRSDTDFIADSTKLFYRDVYDNAVQVIDIVESMRDVVGGLLDLYMTQISNRMNDIMKVLTIIGTIFIPLTFIAGIYGMNFENIPELRAENGYFISLGVMAVITMIMLYFFRRSKWL